MEHIYKLLRSFKWDCAKYLYKNTLNFKVKRLRRKKNIRVLFAVAESATWKSDCLYKAMAEHPRFTPSILVLPDEQKEKTLLKEEVAHFTTSLAGEMSTRFAFTCNGRFLICSTLLIILCGI